MSPFRHSACRRLASALLFAAGVATSPAAQAWGSEGHRVTGLIAEQLLTPQARKAIVAIAGKVDLASEATVLDRHKDLLADRIPGSRHWHYDDRPVCDDQVPRSSYCADGNCASVQIHRHLHVLSDRDAKPAARRFALQVVVHLVGDVHQPLHASDNDDVGGNAVKVRFAIGSQPFETRLHSAWDTPFVRASLPDTDERRSASALLERYGGNIADWQKGTVARWMRDSYDKARSLAYGKLAEGPASCPLDIPDQVDLSPEYVDAALKMVPEQLVRAGARIAYVLNRALAP